MGLHFLTVAKKVFFLDLTRRVRDVSTVPRGFRTLDRTRSGPNFLAVPGEVLICRLYPLPSLFLDRVQRVLNFRRYTEGS